jgi:hypothetical protein
MSATVHVLPNVQQVPARVVIWTRSGRACRVDVIRDTLHGVHQWFVLTTGLFTDRKTIVGPLHSEGEAVAQAKAEVR